MQPGYPLGPRLNLLDRQRISTQSHQRQATFIVTPDAVAVLGASELVRGEMKLAGAEMKEKSKRYG
ncbi:phage holin family protein [Streptomyces sp. TP-A0356]|uniref:phage holin family protein n=1 Tax=Streptomyces sp. TP-A0356 TaxID=1359208 RepID=UPI000AD9775F|nr:phage holin family protein [Streptomyces sp. TP-A0356]